MKLDLAGRLVDVLWAAERAARAVAGALYGWRVWVERRRGRGWEDWGG